MANLTGCKKNDGKSCTNFILTWIFWISWEHAIGGTSFPMDTMMFSYPPWPLIFMRPDWTMDVPARHTKMVKTVVGQNMFGGRNDGLLFGVETGASLFFGQLVLWTGTRRVLVSGPLLISFNCKSLTGEKSVRSSERTKMSKNFSPFLWFPVRQQTRKKLSQSVLHTTYDNSNDHCSLLISSQLCSLKRG